MSLIASATEIVCWLGFESSLVGVSHECDYPQTVRELPRLSAPTFSTEGTSAEIDGRVRGLAKDALSIYRVDREKLWALAPDLIITQDQCAVCAVTLDEVQKSLARPGFSPKLLSLSPHSLDGIFDDIRRVGAALGAGAQAEAKLRALDARMQGVASAARALPSKPTVACLEWLEPLKASGHWIPSLIEMAGGLALFGTPGADGPWLDFKELERRDPEILIAAPCGWPIAKAKGELRRLAPKLGALRAARADRVFACDGNAYFSRPGPRVAETLEILAELLHPQEFRFGLEGAGWRRFS